MQNAEALGGNNDDWEFEALNSQSLTAQELALLGLTSAEGISVGTRFITEAPTSTTEEQIWKI